MESSAISVFEYRNCENKYRSDEYGQVLFFGIGETGPEQEIRTDSSTDPTIDVDSKMMMMVMR
jgi:hypothetical protein